MTAKRRLAEALSSLIDFAARLPGRRFHAFHLEAQARQHHTFGAVTEVAAGAARLRFHTPSKTAHWRADTLFTKEPATIAWIDGFDAGEVFWDVGANVGIYSVYAAVTRGCRTLAVEPSPPNFANLCANVRVNGIDELVDAYCIAFSDRTSLEALHMPSDDVGGAFSSLEAEAAASRRKGYRQAAIAYTVDDFIAAFAPPFPNHIKVDVDGIEDRVVAGASATLADPRLRSLSIEMEVTAPEKTAQIEAALAELGFRRVGEHRSPLYPDSPACNYHYLRRAA